MKIFSNVKTLKCVHYGRSFNKMNQHKEPNDGILTACGSFIDSPLYFSSWYMCYQDQKLKEFALYSRVISTLLIFHSKLGTRNLIPDSISEHLHRRYSANLYSIVIFPYFHMAMTILCLPFRTLFQRYLSPDQREKETSSNFTTICSRKWHIIGIKFIPIILFLFLLVS